MVAAPRWFHVLVQGRHPELALPSGHWASGFTVWRKVRAESAARAEALALARVAGEWRQLGLGDMPSLGVAASAPLGRLAAWVARDSGPQWLPA